MDVISKDGFMHISAIVANLYNGLRRIKITLSYGTRSLHLRSQVIIIKPFTEVALADGMWKQIRRKINVSINDFSTSYAPPKEN